MDKMITPDFVRTMVRYSAWQNRNLFDASERLDDRERKRDRGAFFRSIHETLCHIVWADQLILDRLAGRDGERSGVETSALGIADWGALRDARVSLDRRMQDWAGALQENELEGSVVWGADRGDKASEKPRMLIIVHLFNHGTHHRGQVHAMLTAAGAQPGPTDLPVLPSHD